MQQTYNYLFIHELTKAVVKSDLNGENRGRVIKPKKNRKFFRD